MLPKRKQKKRGRGTSRSYANRQAGRARAAWDALHFRTQLPPFPICSGNAVRPTTANLLLNPLLLPL